MIEIVRQRTVNAPVMRVWDIVHAVERLPEWLSGTETAVSLAGQGQGRQQRVSGHWGSRPFEIDQTVTLYEASHVLTWRHDAERLDGKPAPRISQQTELHIALEPLDTGTRVTLVSRQVPGNPLKGLLIRLIAAPRIRRMLDVSLDNIDKLSLRMGC